MSDSVVRLLWGLVGLNLLLAMLGLYWVRRLKRRFESAFASLDSSRDLGSTIVDYFEKLGVAAGKLTNLEKSYAHLSKIAARSIQKTGIVRFNPFRDTGGEQSFVLALLDNHDSGLLLTSIHGREGTRVYIKPVDYGTSQYELSDEEKEALKAARATQPKDKVKNYAVKKK